MTETILPVFIFVIVTELSFSFQHYVADQYISAYY